MATSTIDAISARFNLRDSYNSMTGDFNTVPLYLGQLNPNSYDQDKLLAIADALAPCLSKTLYSVSEIKSSTLSYSHS